MRTVGEFLGMALFLAICVWVGMVMWAPRPEKPIAAWRPISVVTNQVRDAVVAIAPGGAVDQTANLVTRKMAAGCLTYAANLFEVTRVQ
jgi:hypothetical protein